MLMSVDGKISTGDTVDLDFDLLDETKEDYGYQNKKKD